ncbi:MAG: leucyl aminopeptidase [Rickettsiales bacterium]|jgi:leucyl aminopeptidase
MKINFVNSLEFQENKNNALVLLISEDFAKKSKEIYVKRAKDFYNFTGKPDQINTLAIDEMFLILVGIGEEKNFDGLASQKVGGKISAYLNANKIKDVVVSLNNESEIAADVAFGIKLQSYRFNKYFNDKIEGKEVSLKTVNIVTKEVAKAKKKFTQLDLVAQNIFLARDLVSEPANELNPESYAKICQEIKVAGLEIEVLGEKEMKKLGMGSLLGVGQGSDFESKLVIFKYFGAKNKTKAPLAFVGKGVTFDTGGISIKPSNNMEDMKSDMGGSAVVVSLMKLLAERKAKVNAIGVIGLVENMPSSNAQRPGDVVVSMSGQTIEVINTDAEGRLVLADALHYANTKFKPELIVDLATLTGAVIVSLSDIHAGLFSNDDKIADQIDKAGKVTGETVWRLPLGKEYDAMINSDIADMKNVGSGKGAGSTTAAQFLQRFIGNTKWAHLDIAGVAWKGKGDITAIKGATGFGVNLLNQFVADNYEK